MAVSNYLSLAMLKLLHRRPPNALTITWWLSSYSSSGCRRLQAQRLPWKLIQITLPCSQCCPFFVTGFIRPTSLVSENIASYWIYFKYTLIARWRILRRRRRNANEKVAIATLIRVRLLFLTCYCAEVRTEVQRPHKISPPAAHAVPHLPPPKPSKPSVTASLSQSKSQSGPDFSVPPSQQLLPPRPPIPPPPIPGPSKPIEVMEDFTKTKQPASTVTVSTFYASIEPYIRNIKEEDVGFLEYTGDEVEPFVMPKLGRHYLEIWEDQDMGILPPVILGEPPIAPVSSYAAPTPKWDPSTLSDADLQGEEKGHGPLTERVISALLPVQDAEWKGVKAAEDAMEGRPGGSGAAAARRERLNVTDLETRIRDMMRHHGLLDATVCLSPANLQ